MMYWEEMRSKWGFSEGDAMPCGVEKYREVYVLALNRLLQKYDSAVRVIAYDRGGAHNWCLIVLVPASEVVDLKPRDFLDEVRTSHTHELGEGEADDAFCNAVDDAKAMMLDTYVKVVAKVYTRDLNAFLKQLDKEPVLWEVLTQTPQGWRNIWARGKKPMTFATKAAAETELKDHLETAKEAKMGYQRKDFKVVAFLKKTQ